MTPKQRQILSQIQRMPPTAQRAWREILEAAWGAVQVGEMGPETVIRLLRLVIEWIEELPTDEKAL
ncbi:MAG TPA: hypothetical protein ENJ31_13585 [Anaerolineae bacterium]|nr:hypothetical protein [Anaerolineae bacterium]